MTQLSLDDLLDEAPAPRTLVRGGGGPGRLMKALVRAGLREDLWTSAASLVIALDAEAAKER